MLIEFLKLSVEVEDLTVTAQAAATRVEILEDQNAELTYVFENPDNAPRGNELVQYLGGLAALNQDMNNQN
jgi:hypothetical protein